MGKREKVVADIHGLPKERRAQHIFFWVLRLGVILVAALALSYGDWEYFFISLLTLFLSFLPEMIEHRLDIVLPVEFQTVIVGFIYLSVFAGEAIDIYERIWWWDAMLHVASGLALSFAAYLLLYTMYKRKKIITSPFVIALLVFTFGLAFGAVWEIFEYVVDNVFGTIMQRNSLRDTMSDLSIDALGSLLVAWAGYRQIIDGRNDNILGKLTKRFMDLNTTKGKKEK